MRCSPLLALVMLGCQPAPAPVPQESQKPQEAPVRATAPPSLAEPAAPAASGEDFSARGALVGEYRIAGVNEMGIDLPYGISAQISDDTIVVTADCVRLAWSYAFEGSTLVTEPLPSPGGCDRALIAEEQAIEAAFGGANSVIRLPSNGIEFSGAGGRVLLFSQ